MSSPVWIVARLAWKRTIHTRMIWATLFLILMPVAMAAVLAEQALVPMQRWQSLVEVTLQLVMLAAAIHLATAVAEEIQGKRHTYFWSRAVPRWVLILGKMAAVVPALVVAFAVSLTVAFPIAFGTGAGSDWSWLLRALTASTAAAVVASSLAVGVGALFPEHPFVFSVAYVLTLEQSLPQIPLASNLSISYHLRAIAGLPGPHLRAIAGLSGPAGGPESLPVALTALALLSAGWLAVGLWRFNVAERAAAGR